MKEQLGLSETPSDLVDNLERFSPSDILEARIANRFGRPHVCTVYARRKKVETCMIKPMSSLIKYIAFNKKNHEYVSFIFRSSFFLHV